MSRLAARLIVVSALLAACSGSGTTPTTDSPPVEPSTTTAPPTTQVESTTAVSEEPIVVGPIEEQTRFSQRRLLIERHRYLFQLQFDVIVTPPTAGWYALGHDPGSAVLFGWAGPSGFRHETLDVLLFDPGSDVDAAWERFKSLIDTALGGGWTWNDSGTMSIAGETVEWQEFRVSDAPTPAREPGDPRVVSLEEVGRATLWRNTTARVAVVESEGLTLTVVAYETRCACDVQSSWNRDDHVDSEENELHDWLPELEEFLGSITFAD